MEDMLFLLSRTFDRSGKHVKRAKMVGLEDEIFDESLLHITCLIKYSTRHAFRDEGFFNELPPKLRSCLINEVLKKQINKLEFFFNDHIKNISAP